MFAQIFKYEINYWLKRPSTYIYFLTFFAFAFLALAGTAGLFDPAPTTPQTNHFLNGPYEINYILQYFNKFFLFLLPAIIGATIFKDYKGKVHSLLYSFPIRKSDYLLGKFLSAFVIVAAITLVTVVGLLAAEQLPNLHPHKIGPFRLVAYLQAFGLYILPNMFISGIFVFAVVTLFRSIYAGFGTIIILFLFQIITQNAFSNNGFLIALLDPFAQNTVTYLTQYWTLEERNTKVLPVMGVLLYNRLLWLSIALVVFGFTHKVFSFTEHGLVALFKKTGGKRLIKDNFGGQVKVHLSNVNYDFSILQRLKDTWNLSNLDFKFIFKSRLFFMLLSFGIFAMIFALGKVTNNEDMILLPVTRIMLTIPAFFFTNIIILLTFIYSGMLIHRERNAGMNQLVDATAVPNWVLLCSKVLAIIKMQAVLLLTMLIAGIVLQVYNGYYNFELGLYLKHLFGISAIVLVIWAFVSVLLHTVFTNTYLGIFALVVAWLGLTALPEIGIRSKTLTFNSPPQLFYSDLNQYGNQLKAYFMIESYWLMLGLLFLVLSYLFWFRGLPDSLKERIQLAKARFGKPAQALTSVLLIAFVALGFGIYKAESNDLNLSNKKQKQIFKAFEDEYKQYTNIVQPRITDVTVAVDLYPENHAFEANGFYKIVNKSPKVIDTLLVKLGFDEISEFKIDRAFEVISEDKNIQFSVLKLKEGLQPNEQMRMDFHVKNKSNTLFERNSNILQNGTFLKHDFFPRLGYFLDRSKKQPTDSTALGNHFYAIDSDIINFNATVSTSKDQIAIVPGYVQKEWTEGDRRYFEYKLDNEIKFLVGFNSGKFEVKKDTWNEVELEVYYHKAHNHNLTEMLNGLKASLDYNTKYFGKYQHKQARIIEFPQSEGTYATTYANSIPMSEIHFIGNPAEDKVALSFYVPCHELTHQWWGNQLVPADALGAVMLTESITEYVTLQVYKKEYGPEKAMQFLRKQRGRYLRGRKHEGGKENPLFLVEPEQQYISYGKGSMAFNSLSQYIGEENLNKCLRGFLETHKFKPAPYATSVELIDLLRTSTPDSLQYLITDLFETITFYDNKINDATIKELTDAKYQVAVDLSINKYREDNSEIDRLADYIELAVYNEQDELLYLKQHKITDSNQQLMLNLDQKPTKVVIDPNLLLIDKNQEDNVLKF